METIKTELFIHSNEEIPNSFIKFADINSLVDRCTAIPDVKIYFKTTGLVVNICQPIQQEDDIDINSFAHFYSHYTFNEALHALITDENSTNNFRLYPIFTNLYEVERFKLDIGVYIRKEYLIELYELDKMPLIMKKLVHQYKENYSKSNEIELKTAINNPECNSTIEDKYKIQPMLHQKNNIEWLKSIETKIRNNLLIFETFKLDNDLVYFYIESINDYIICDLKTYTFIKPETLSQQKFEYKGGVLADSIGLGKTLSFISLILESPTDNPSIVFCPKRICKQWESEIHKFTDLLKVKVIGNITQYKKLTEDNIKNFHVYIVPYSLFESKKYLQIRATGAAAELRTTWTGVEGDDGPYYEPHSCIFENYLWERVILDESHEYIGTFIKKTGSKNC